MIDRLGRVSIGLLLFWVPLAFFNRSADGFVLPKEIVAIGAGFLLLGLTLHTHALAKKTLVYLLAFFCLWMIGDGFLIASDPWSVIGGSAYLWVIFLTFLGVIMAAEKGVSYEKMLHGVLAAGVIAAAYGISQTVGADATHWDTHFERRAFGTLGNPDYLAGYLVALLPLSLVLTMRSSGQRAWVGFRAITFLLFAGLLMTRVRGALLALIIALLVLSLGLFMPWGRELVKKNKKTLWIVLAVLVAGAVAFWLRYGGWNAFEWGQASIQQRLQTYRVGMEMIKEHPINGIGLGQLGRDFALYQWKAYAPADLPNHPFVLTEHMHNEFLQIAVEGGWVGLALFLLVLLVYLWLVLKLLKHPDIPIASKELLLGVLASLAGLLGQAVTNFPFQVIPTGVLLGFFLASPLVLGFRQPHLVKSNRVGAAHLALLSVGLLLLGVFGAKTMAASIALRDTLGETNLNKPGNALQYANRLAALAATDPKAWDAVAKARELNKQLEEALSAYDKEIAINPNAVEAYYAMAQDQLMLGRTEEALCTCQKNLAMAPNYSASLWLEGICYFTLNRYEQAAANFERYLPYAPNVESVYVNLGVCYVKSGHKADAITAWKKAYSLNPNDAQVAGYLKSVGVKI